MAKRNHPEDALQAAVVQLLAIYEAQGKLKYFAIPNGGKRDAITGAIMKRLGTRAGVPDICLLFANGGTVFLELKAPKGSASTSQLEWMTWLNTNGFHSWIVRNLHEVEGIVKANLVGRAA